MMTRGAVLVGSVIVEAVQEVILRGTEGGSGLGPYYTQVLA